MDKEKHHLLEAGLTGLTENICYGLLTSQKGLMKNKISS